MIKQSALNLGLIAVAIILCVAAFYEAREARYEALIALQNACNREMLSHATNKLSCAELYLDRQQHN